MQTPPQGPYQYQAGVPPPQTSGTSLVAQQCMCFGLLLALMFGFGLMMAGIGLSASGYGHEPGSFFYRHSAGERTAGPICLTIGVILFSVGIFLCVRVCRQRNQQRRNVQYSSTAVSGPGGTVVLSGAQPTGGYGPYGVQHGGPGYPIGVVQPGAPPAGYVQHPHTLPSAPAPQNFEKPPPSYADAVA